MKKLVTVAVVLAVAVALSYGAYAAEAAPAAKAAAPAAKAAAPAAKPAAAKPVMVVGKIEVKTEKVGEKEAKVPYLTVAEAKEGAKEVAALKGKVLKVVGPKVADAEKLAGKEVEAKGVVKEDKEIDVTLVVEKKAPAKPVAKPAAAPAPKAK